MRILLDALLFGAVLFAPLWVVVALSAIGIFMFAGYTEVVIAFFVYDLLYFGGAFFLNPTTFTVVPLTLYAFLALMGSAVLRQRIRK